MSPRRSSHSPWASRGRPVMPTVHAEFRTEMQRQPGSPRMVAAGRVEQQHIRWRRQRPTVASIGRPILSASSPGLYGASATPRRISRSSTTPPRMTTAASRATSPAPPSPLRPRGKYTQQPPTRGSPRQVATAPRGLRQLALDVDQRLGVDRPHMTILSRSPGMARCAVHPVIAPGLLGCELVAHDLENRVHVRQRPNLDDERQHAPCHLGLGCLSPKAVGNRK